MSYTYEIDDDALHIVPVVAWAMRRIALHDLEAELRPL